VPAYLLIYSFIHLSVHRTCLHGCVSCGSRYVVRVPGKLCVLRRCRLRVSGAAQVRVYHRCRRGVHLRLRHGIQCWRSLLDHTTAAQLHLKSLSLPFSALTAVVTSADGTSCWTRKAGPKKATLVVLLVVGISSLKIPIPKALLTRSATKLCTHIHADILPQIYRLRFSADVTCHFCDQKFVPCYRFKTWH